MTRIAILFFVLTGLAAIGLVVLSNWQIPAPITATEDPKGIFDVSIIKTNLASQTHRPSNLQLYNPKGKDHLDPLQFDELHESSLDQKLLE